MSSPEPDRENRDENINHDIDIIHSNAIRLDATREQCDFNTTVYEPMHPCNQFLLKQENIERDELANTPDSNDLYPVINDPNFSLKIANKREFHDTMYDGTVYNVEERATNLGKLEFELSPHQLFVKNFLSSHTPYNSLLLFHGLGTGKTCSAIGICEEHRDYIRQTGNSQKILIVASPNVQDNFRLQLFNEATMTNVNGEWSIKSCIGNKLIREINPTKTRFVTKERTILQINRIINESYEFMGYREFANYIEKRGEIGLRSDEPSSSPKNIARIKRNLKEDFEGRLICIDEVHNIRNADDSGNKIVANQFMLLVKSARRMKLLLLSGTPMFNTYKEIIWLANIMNMNDGRGLIKVGDVFNAKGEFHEASDHVESGKEILMRKLTGYVSFVRGENPYTFPYRMYPNTFAPEQTFMTIPQQTKSIVGGEVIPNEVTTITDKNVYVVKLGEYQEEVYTNMTSDLDISTSTTEFNEAKLGNENDAIEPPEGAGRLGYTQLQDPIQSLNMTFPANTNTTDISTTEDIHTMVEEGKVSVKDTIGTRGLKATMDYIDERTESNYVKGSFSYKPWVQKGSHKNFFSSDNVGNYSGKIKHICDCVTQSTGVILIYSQYLDGGLIPMALALESLGITRYGSADKSLFKTPPSTPLRMGSNKLPAKYIMITGDKRLSPDNALDISEVTKDKNLYGDYIKVVLVSMAGSEGVDLKFIRQVHILEPWYNRSRIEQIEGRAVRHNSHKLLPFRERNVQVFLYGSSVRDESLETVDMYVYRNAEFKAIQIGRVTRVLKELSVDCFLNHSQTNFSVEKMNQTVEQELSSGKVITEFSVGDHANTMLTDFMESGEHKCYSQADVVNIIEDSVNYTTYDERFIMLNTDSIIQKIRSLFKERHFYKKNELMFRLGAGPSPRPMPSSESREVEVRKYPIAQVYAALTTLVDTDTEYITDAYGRTGRLVNIGDYYLFQPIELMDNHITLFERSIPLQYKHEKLKIKMDITPEIDDDILRAAGQSNTADDRMNNPTPAAKTQEDEDSLNLEAVPSLNVESIASSHAHISRGDAIVSQILDAYNDANYGFYIPNGIPRGNPKLYRYFGTAMNRMLRTKIITCAEEVRGFLLDHLMDTISIEHRITLLHYVFDNRYPTLDTDIELHKDDAIQGKYTSQDKYNDKWVFGRITKVNTDGTYNVIYDIDINHDNTDDNKEMKNVSRDMVRLLDFKKLIKEWFISQQIETTGDFPLTAMVFYVNTKSNKENKENDIKIYIRGNANESHTWTPAEPEDIKDILEHINLAHPLLLENVSDLFGFNGDDLKNQNIIFKLKNKLNSRSKGHRCSEMKKDGKVDILQKLLPSETVANLKYVNLNKGKEKDITYHVMQEACVFVEFTLRYYNSIAKDDKRWFLSYNEYNRFRDILGV